MSFKSYPFIIFVIYSHVFLIHGASRIRRDLNLRQTKIVGGEIIDIEQAPFNVALEYLSRQICGGAILTKQWVVTAAHCFGRGFFLRSQAVVRAGSGQRQCDGTEHEVKQIIKHPDFVIKVNDNDVALLQVYPPLQYSSRIAPINLPNPSYKPREGDLLQIFGFGYTKESGDPSRFLRTVHLPLYSHQECTQIYRETLNVTHQMLCAGYQLGGRDACVLDSGGPLVWQGRLYGIVSWGFGCAREFYPGVFTDLSAPLVKQWILQYIYH